MHLRIVIPWRIEPFANLPRRVALGRKLHAVFILEQLHGVRFCLRNAHIAFLRNQIRILFLEADLHGHGFKPVFFLNRPLVEQPAECFTADGHERFFLPVALSIFQRLHDFCVFIQRNAVLIQDGDKLRKLLMGIGFFRSVFHVVLKRHGHGDLLNDLPVGQQRCRHSGCCAEHEGQDHDPARRQLSLYFSAFDGLLIQPVTLAGRGAKSR